MICEKVHYSKRRTYTTDIGLNKKCKNYIKID